MITPFDLIASNKPAAEVVKALAVADGKQLCLAAEELSDEDFEQLHRWMIVKLSASGVQHLLFCGGLLYCFRLAANERDRQLRFQEMVDELNISTTKAYDSISVFTSFGRVLLAEPALIQQFTMESLKILSGVSANDDAREAAIAIARKGERVTIKMARSLVEELSMVPRVDTDIPAVEKSERPQVCGSSQEGSESVGSAPAWTYQGVVVRLSIEFVTPESARNSSSVLFELQAAVEQFRREHDLANAD